MIPSAASVRKTLSEPIQRLVKSYPSVARFPIAWGEQDTFRHLNNVWHVRYFENGRFSFMQQVLAKHLTAKQMDDFLWATGVGVIMKSVAINYKSPMTFPDNMIVATSMGNLRKDRFTQFSLLISEQQEAVVAEAVGCVVMYDHLSLKKADLPREYVKAYEAIVSQVGPQTPFPVARM